MKYIVTETDDGEREIFTFPSSISHDAMAEVLWRIRNQTHGDWKRVDRKPVSAGMINLEGVCYGDSESLKLKSNESDSKLLKNK